MKFDEMEFLREAVKIDSSTEVEEMRNFLLETLESYELEPEVDEAGNTLCTRGTGRPHLVLNTHIDTVQPHIELEETEEKIKGRGSCDAKGPLAALLKAFIESEINGKLTLAVTPDEETTLQGSKKLDLDPDAVIVGEPTNLDPCIAARGWAKVDIKFSGESAHASEPENGVSAIKAASYAVIALENFDKQYNYENDMLPDPNLTATIIEGGEAENQIPSTSTVTVDRRVVPPETPQDFREKITEYLEKKIDTEAEVTVELPESSEPLSAFETPQEAEIVEIMEKQSESKARIFEAATEASRFNDSHVVVFGPGVLADEKGGVAHSKREHVRKESVEKAGEIVKKSVKDYLS
jgi:acetylornithine deacetylase